MTRLWFALVTTVFTSVAAAQAPHTHHHSFAGAEHWAKVFDDPARDAWQKPHEVIEALKLAPDAAVADIGAGTGYFAIPMARIAGPRGTVFAVDLQQEMLELLRPRLSKSPNVTPLLGSAHQTTIADDSCDLVFFANVWHELDDRDGVLAEALRVLRHGGRVAVLDWRPDADPPPGPPQDHRVPMSSVAEALVRNGWRLDSMRRVGAYSYLVIAEQPRNETR